jgi:hypothetical protein
MAFSTSAVGVIDPPNTLKPSLQLDGSSSFFCGTCRSSLFDKEGEHVGLLRCYMLMAEV